jgi:hypothetical protein
VEGVIGNIGPQSVIDVSNFCWCVDIFAVLWYVIFDLLGSGWFGDLLVFVSFVAFACCLVDLLVLVFVVFLLFVCVFG